MPNCVVKGCTKHTSKHKKLDGITFHTFPTRYQNIKEKWIAVICDSRNEPSWQPTSSSVVCSAHFNSEDFYYTQKGLRRVVKNGYPKILPHIIEGLDNVDLSQRPNVKEESAPPDLSNDLNLSQPSSPYAIVPIKREILDIEDLSQPPNVIVPIKREILDNEDLSQPPNVNEEYAAPDLSNYVNISQPSSSYAIVPIKKEVLDIEDLSQPPNVILPNNIEGLRNEVLSQPLNIKEKSAAPDLSNDLNLSQPSFSYSIVPIKIEVLDNEDLSQPNVKEDFAAPHLSNHLNISQPSSSYVQDLPAAPDLSNDLNPSQRSSSCADEAAQSDSSSIFDTPRRHKLRKRVKSLEKKLKISRRKIKTLNQKIRRLVKRNKTLREILDNRIVRDGGNETIPSPFCTDEESD